jgi:AAA15 family ATPase/GTPase
MKLKLDNYMAFNDFEMSMTYAKKIVGNQMTECLKDHPNFRYKKLNILMGANASGKTAIGRMLLSILNFIARKEYAGITSRINDTEKDAVFEIQFVVNDDFYRVSSIIKGKKENKSYSSSDFLMKVEQTEIGKSDTYEKTLEKLNAKSDTGYCNDYIRELEKIKNLSWAFEFSGDSVSMAAGYTPKNEERYLQILKNTLQALDPLITDVERVKEVKDTYVIKLGGNQVIIKNGVIADDGLLSSGTREGVSLANMFAAMASGMYSFFYCDEKFSFIHSDIEKAFLSLMAEKLEGDRQLFFTTHNTDILDMNFPKHCFNFLRKEVFDGICSVFVINAGDYIKKNRDSVKTAVQNDLFSSAPMLEKIFALADCGGLFMPVRR